MRNSGCRRLLLAIVAAFAASGAAAEPVAIRTRMIAAFGGEAEAEGRLTFLGGLVMNGPSGFGALSAARIAGDRLLAASDTGMWFTARMVLAGGRPLGLADTELFPRRDVTGREITAKLQGDAEALTLMPGGVVVAVEQSGQLLRYPADGIALDRDATPTRLTVPLKLISAARRLGLEALATAQDGTLVAIAEGRRGRPGDLPAFRIEGRPFSVARDGDWSVTDADRLPGGDMVIVERHYGGGFDVGMRVRRLGVDDIASATGTIDGPVLLEAGFSSQIDNMEAVAVSQEDGRTVLTFLSDDNESLLQRSLLLRFALREALPPRRPDPSQTALWPDAAPEAAGGQTAVR